jgi:hypothetical protein
VAEATFIGFILHCSGVEQVKENISFFSERSSGGEQGFLSLYDTTVITLANKSS